MLDTDANPRAPGILRPTDRRGGELFSIVVLGNVAALKMDLKTTFLWAVAILQRARRVCILLHQLEQHKLMIEYQEIL
jgi:hypothetical protein